VRDFGNNDRVSSDWENYEMSMDNEDFAEYVERYAKARGISIAVALTHEIVKEYGRYLKWVNT
jgi:type IV secretory pathway component VirB8